MTVMLRARHSSQAAYLLYPQLLEVLNGALDDIGKENLLIQSCCGCLSHKGRVRQDTWMHNSRHVTIGFYTRNSARSAVHSYSNTPHLARDVLSRSKSSVAFDIGIALGKCMDDSSNQDFTWHKLHNMKDVKDANIRIFNALKAEGLRGLDSL